MVIFKCLYRKIFISQISAINRSHLIFYHSIRICFINPCKIYILIAPTRSNITAYYITCLISRQCGSIVRAPTRYASDVLSNISYQVFSLSLSRYSLLHMYLHFPSFSLPPERCLSSSSLTIPLLFSFLTCIPIFSG